MRKQIAAFGATLVLIASCASFVIAQRPADPKANWKPEDGDDDRWQQTEFGPFLSSVLATPGGTVAKGLSIRLGAKRDCTAVYDTRTASFRAFWTGDFVAINKRKFGIVTAPTIAGDVHAVCGSSNWRDSTVRYQGLYQSGDQCVLRSNVDSVNVLESPSVISCDQQPVFIRRIQVGAHERPMSLALQDSFQYVKQLSRTHAYTRWSKQVVHIRLLSDQAKASLLVNEDTLLATLPPQETKTVLVVAYYLKEDVAADAIKAEVAKLESISGLVSEPKALWGKPLETKGELSSENAAYVVDTIGVPFDNPFKALMFITGHDFFSDGTTLAVCTLHGDVWLVSGVDRQLEKIRWGRYATGLHQPLGLRIVDDQIYVLGRDQITRLHDRNQDGEADYYEAFNNAGETSINGHDYAACLETDAEGNFYYIRAHEGVVRVSADGQKHEALATGFRNPVGLGVSPSGRVTASPQEGNWTPASAIFEVRRGGYYGFGGPKVTKQRPLGYDPPICWMPRLQDNSSGGQAWVTSNRWGPLNGQMLHFSYGQCAMLLTLQQRMDQVTQGGTVRFPFYFRSGVMRGRFNPKDGQLYVSGLRGWQTSAADDGCLQRVRYTGAEVLLPTEFQVTRDGLAIRFSTPLDEETAADPDNYFVEWWNYKYAADYGSQDYRVSQPNRFGRDEVFVDDVRLSEDRKTIYLQLEEIQPVMQMSLEMNIKTASGQPLKHVIYNTVHRIPEASNR